jgi:hypothetical protein
MDAVDEQAFAADFTIVRPLGQQESTARVEQAPPNRRIKVGDVVMLRTPTTASTCRETTHECQDGIDEAALAYLGIGSEFYAANPAAQIRVSMARRTGGHTISEQDIAGQVSACLSIPVSGGSESYCVTQAGVVAQVARADVRIQLTAYSTTVPDSAVFTEVFTGE